MHLTNKQKQHKKHFINKSIEVCVKKMIHNVLQLYNMYIQIEKNEIEMLPTINVILALNIYHTNLQTMSLTKSLYSSL